MIGWMLRNPNRFHYLVAKQHLTSIERTSLHMYVHVPIIQWKAYTKQSYVQNNFVHKMALLHLTHNKRVKKVRKWWCHVVPLAPQSVTLLAKKSKPCQYFKAHFHLYTLGNFRRFQLHFKPLTSFGVDHLNLFLLTSSSTILTTMCWTNNGTAARDCLHATAYTRLPTCNCLHATAYTWLVIREYILCSTKHSEWHFL